MISTPGGTFLLCVPVFIIFGLMGIAATQPEKEAGSWEVAVSKNETFKNGLSRLEVSAQQGNSRIGLTMVRFRSTEFEMIVIDNGRNLNQPLFDSLEDALLQRNCLAGSNGGFFDRSRGKPKGLVVAEGKRIEGFDPQALLDAALAVQNRKLVLESVGSFQANEGTTQLVQSQPWLLRKGAINPVSGDQRAVRTFVGTDGGSGWILGQAQYCTLGELAEVLASPSFRKSVPLQDVLNLDGGPSSGLWIQGDSGTPFYLKEWTPVLNYIGIRRISTAGDR